MDSSAEILPLETAAQFRYAVARAAALLAEGEVVGLPTETVYGLAANAFDESAVQKIFQIKGRPAHNPLIVHISGLAMAYQCASAWPGMASRLAAAFWPGPLTLVVKKNAVVPEAVTAGGDTVALRWPGHPFMRAVIEAAHFPLAAPSANLSGQISPTSARHVSQALGNKLKLIVDGGHSQVGIESTVVDCTGSVPIILRPGIISRLQIHETLGLNEEAAPVTRGSGTLRSPGLLEKHYAPKAQLLVRSWTNDKDLVQIIRAAGFQPGDAHLITHSEIPAANAFASVSVIPLDAEAYARAIYSELHQRDEAGAKLIVIEQLPGTSEWEGINDRLRRASK